MLSSAFRVLLPELLIAFVLLSSWHALVRAEGPQIYPGRFGKATDVVSTPLRTRSLDEYAGFPLTVEMWIKLPEASKSRYHVLASNSPGSPSGHWELYSTSRNGQLQAKLSGVTPRLLRGYVRVTDGKWHHIAMTCDGRQWSLFVDGKVAGSQAIEVDENAEFMPGELFVGPDFDRDEDSTEPGLIDELRISRAIRDVSRLPDAPLSADEQTIGLWRFDEVEGNRRQDVSRMANHLAYSPGVESAWTPRSSTSPGAEAWERETDAHWLDDRFNHMDTGSILGASIAVRGLSSDWPRPYAAKGLAIRVGSRGEAAVLFDRGLVQMPAAWTGNFVRIPSRRFGLIEHPQPAGPSIFTAPSGPGWERSTDVVAEPDRWAPLPRDWARYEGVYLHGERTVLSYTVAGTSVLDMPWAVSHDDVTAVTRTLQVATRQRPLRMTLTRERSVQLQDRGDLQLALLPDGSQIVAIAYATGLAGVKLSVEDQTTTLEFAPSDNPLLAKLFMWRGAREDLERFVTLAKESRDAEVPETFTRGGPAQWTHEITTRGVLGEPPNGSAFAVDTLTLPYGNPYGSIFYVTGVGFLDDNRIAISTIYGDVWIVEASGPDLKTLRWKRFAAGLYQPLGLAIKDGKICVLERGQITRLHDLNRDGEADFHENLYHGWQTPGSGHAYDTALKLAPDGSFFFFKGQVAASEPCRESGCLVRVLPDASGHEVFATGFRHPIGLGVGPDGTVTGGDQQGNWMPATRIDRYRRGGFYGDMRTHHRDQPPESYAPPICWLPQYVDNSAGGQVSVPVDGWGPLGGKTLHLSWGRCRVYLVLQQQIGKQVQGGVVRLPMDKLLSGPITGAFHPREGQLYVAGLHGWQTAAESDGCLQRIRYAGGKLRLPVDLRIVPEGVRLQFAEPLERLSASDLDNYSIEQWNYRYSGDYGSDHWSVSDPERNGHDPVPVDAVEVSADGRDVLLRIDSLQPVMQMKIDYRLRASDGTPVADSIHHTIHVVPSE